MNVLAEGILGQDVPMREILKRILLMKAPGVSFLQITNADGRVTGRVRVIDSTHITGALLASSPAGGYPALKTLLEIKDGTYALFAGRQSDREDGKEALNIELSKVLENLDHLPEIPESVTSPFDQSEMLDRIFNGEDPEGVTNAVQAPQDMQSIMGKVVVGPETAPPKDPSWSAVEPLAAEGGNGNGNGVEDGAEEGEGDSRKTAAKMARSADSKQTQLKIRALRNDKKTQNQRLMRLAFTTVFGVLFIVGGIIGVVWTLRSSQSTAGAQPSLDQSNAQVASHEEDEATAEPVAKAPEKERPSAKKKSAHKSERSAGSSSKG